jgi:hypothetical protein
LLTTSPGNMSCRKRRNDSSNKSWIRLFEIGVWVVVVVEVEVWAEVVVWVWVLVVVEIGIVVEVWAEVVVVVEIGIEGGVVV